MEGDFVGTQARSCFLFWRDMIRFEVHQGLKPEEMKRKEPNQTKSIPFVGNDTNMYFIRMGGGVGLVHCNSRFPGRSWDGMIFSKDSDKLIDDMIESLQWLKKNKKIMFATEKELKAMKEKDEKAAT